MDGRSIQQEIGSPVDACAAADQMVLAAVLREAAHSYGIEVSFA